jgi:hypothetical protein
MFAVTELTALRVKVQLGVLAPALLQAPDQTALRPLETVSLMEVPLLKRALPVIPTVATRPAGVEVTFSPVLPVAVTESSKVVGVEPPGQGAPRLTISE